MTKLETLYDIIENSLERVREQMENEENEHTRLLLKGRELGLLEACAAIFKTMGARDK